jgi:hypothetical protein
MRFISVNSYLTKWDFISILSDKTANMPSNRNIELSMQ